MHPKKVTGSLLTAFSILRPSLWVC